MKAEPASMESLYKVPATHRPNLKEHTPTAILQSSRTALVADMSSTCDPYNITVPDPGTVEFYISHHCGFNWPRPIPTSNLSACCSGTQHFGPESPKQQPDGDCFHWCATRLPQGNFSRCFGSALSFDAPAVVCSCNEPGECSSDPPQPTKKPDENEVGMLRVQGNWMGLVVGLLVVGVMWC